MPVTELMLQNIIEKTFRSILSLDDNQAASTQHDLNTLKQAFRQALSRAFQYFEEQHPQWSTLLFDSGFFEKEGVLILAQFLQQNSNPITNELALLWLQK